MEEHNELARESDEGASLGPRQAWALGVLDDAGRGLSEEEVDYASQALRVGRSQSVRRELGRIE